MGCDIEFFGALPSSEARAECLQFLAMAKKQYTKVIVAERVIRHTAPVVFSHMSALRYNRVANYRTLAGELHQHQMFAGFHEGFRELQILFDVSCGGHLCMLVLPDEVPDAFNPEGRWHWAPDNLFPWGFPPPSGTAIAFLGSRTRIDPGDPFLPSLLVCLKCRFMPELIVSDDYYIFEKACKTAREKHLDRLFAKADPVALAQLHQEFERELL